MSIGKYLRNSIPIKTISFWIQGVPEPQMLSCHLINIKLTTVIQIAMSKGRFTIFF